MKKVKGIITVLVIMAGIKSMQGDNRCFSLQSNDTIYTVKLEINNNQVKADYIIAWTGGTQKNVRTGNLSAGSISFQNKQFVNGSMVKTTLVWTLNANSLQLENGKLLMEGSCPN